MTKKVRRNKMPLNENPFFNKLAKPKEEEELFDNPEEDAPQFENTEDIENFGDELGLPETQQIPYAPKEDLRMMDTLDAIKANPTIVPENDGGAGDSYYADTLPEQQNVEQGIQDKISEVDKIKQLIAKSKSARGQSPQQEEAQIDPSTGKLIEARKNRDMQQALAQMMSGIKRAGAAYGGAGLTQIKANTEFEDSTTKNAGQELTDVTQDLARDDKLRKEKEAKAIEEIQNRRLGESSRLQNLLAQAKINKINRPDAPKQSALEDKKELAKFKSGISKEAADEKEQKTIKKENRKFAKELGANHKALIKQLDMLKNSKKKFNEYSGWGGTGPISQMFGLKPMMDDKAGTLKSMFNQVSLDNMKTIFAGMSKAIDSDSERAFFQSTQPSMTNDDGTNNYILDRQIEVVEGLINKVNDKRSDLSREGDFTKEEVSEDSASPIEYVTLQSPSGDKKLVRKDKVEKYIKKGAKLIQD